MADPGADLGNGVASAPYHADYAVQQHTLMGGTTEDFFFNSTHHFLQDMELPDSWDLNFDSYTIPQIDIQQTSPQSTATTTSKHLARDPTRGYAAFKRSPWLWEPKSKDSLGREQEGLVFNEKTVAQSPAYERVLSANTSRLKIDAAIRDRLFASVLSLHKNSAISKSKYPSKIPSFPSLELLNHLLQTHFVQDEYEAYSWIHAASFNPSKAIPELLLALISSGAGVIAVPAIWQFGLSRKYHCWPRSSAYRSSAKPPPPFPKENNRGKYRLKCVIVVQEIVRIGLSVLVRNDSHPKTEPLSLICPSLKIATPTPEISSVFRPSCYSLK
jgi:hypothetical protein